MKLSNWLQWLIGLFCGVAGLALYITSKYVGYEKEYPQGVGEVSLKYQQNFTVFSDEIAHEIELAKDNITIMSRYFNPGDEISITDSLLSAAKRGVSIELITTNKTNTDTTFFSSIGTNFKYRVFNNSKYADSLISDFIIIDSSKYLQFSNFYDINISDQGGFIISIIDQTIVADAIRIFKMYWTELSDTESLKLPPNHYIWPYEYTPLTSKEKPVKMKNGASVYLTIPNQLDVINGRSLIRPIIEDMLSSLESSEVYISSSYFEMPSNAFFQNSLVAAIFNKSNVSIMISNNKYCNLSLRSAGMVAPFRGINVCYPNITQNYIDYMIIDDTLFFVSDSVTGRLFQKAMGIGLVIKDQSLTNNIKKYSQCRNDIFYQKETLSYIYGYVDSFPFCR